MSEMVNPAEGRAPTPLPPQGPVETNRENMPPVRPSPMKMITLRDEDPEEDEEEEFYEHVTIKLEEHSLTLTGKETAGKML